MNAEQWWALALSIPVFVIAGMSLMWVFHDAKGRPVKSPGLVLVLCAFSWPYCLLFWFVFRPTCSRSDWDD
jgi:hypothetical protein